MRLPLLLAGSLVLAGAALGQTVRHKYSFNGEHPLGWEKVLASRDSDGDAYEVWQSPQEQPIKQTRVIYTVPKTWWKDQQYITGYAPSGTNPFLRQPPGDYPNDSVSYIGHRQEVWSALAKDFLVQEDENDVPTWISGQSTGQPGWSFLEFSFAGSPGVWKHGYMQYHSGRSDNGFVNGFKKNYFISFWPGSPVAKTTGITNPFDEDEDGSGSGGGGGDGDPNADGWGTFLSLDWWKKLCIFLFVPSESDFQVVKNAIAQFQEWGPFALVADVSSALGSIAGGAPATNIDAMQIQFPNFYLPGGYGPITGVLDLRPWGVYLQMVRSFILGLAMIRMAKFWGEKYRDLGSRS